MVYMFWKFPMIKKLPSSGYHLPVQRTIFVKIINYGSSRYVI